MVPRRVRATLRNWVGRLGASISLVNINDMIQADARRKPKPVNSAKTARKSAAGKRATPREGRRRSSQRSSSKAKARS
eukprot:1016552-Amphidinium_carterae.1